MEIEITIPGLRDFDRDQQFFVEHPDRETRIRKAEPGEAAEMFEVLGDHQKDRRRVLCWKVPKGRQYAGEILKMPFLALADEEIADSEALGLKLLDEIMENAKEDHQNRMLHG